MPVLDDIFSTPLVSGSRRGDAPIQSVLEVQDQYGRPVSPTLYAHAPKGGVTIKGKTYKGGEFIPAEVLVDASPEERRAVESGESRGKPLPPEGGVREPKQKSKVQEWLAGTKVVDKRGNPAKVYRGAYKDDHEPPIFLTTKKSSANTFVEDQPGARMYSGFVSIKNPLDLGLNDAKGAAELVDIAREAGVQGINFKVYPEGDYEFSCPEIAGHSPFEGENIQDLVYIPAVREGLKRRGYDGLALIDQFMGEDLAPTFVALDSNQVKLS